MAATETQSADEMSLARPRTTSETQAVANTNVRGVEDQLTSESSDGTSTARDNHQNEDRVNASPNRDKPRICRFYRTRTCRYGISGKGCLFSHPRPCARFMKHGMDRRIGCTKGRYCKDYHPIICRESLFRRFCDNRECKYTHLKGTRKYGNPPGEVNASDHHHTRDDRATWEGRRDHQPTYSATRSTYEGNTNHPNNHTPQPDRTPFLEEITLKLEEMQQNAQNIMMHKFAEMQQQSNTLLSQLMNRMNMLEQTNQRGNFVPHY